MRIAYTPEQEELRTRLRAYFAALMTPERREALTGDGGEYGDGTAYKETVRRMGADGWLTLGWPRRYGGGERSAVEQMIFADEAALAGAPVPFLTINTIGPTIMRYGTEAQRGDLLPRIAAGEVHFSVGYSEPEAGTDLAGLRTRAVREGEGYRITGQKMWTSLIQYADYVWLACRTDPEADKHKGLSILIVPTGSPGFSYTPVHTVSGVTTSATYYSDVRVPASALVGEENGGWKLVTNQLNHERVALTSAAPVLQALREVTDWARNTKRPDGSRVLDSEWVRLHLARVHAKASFARLMNAKIAAGDGVGPADASATKIFGTEFATEAYRLLMEVLGTAGYLRGDTRGAALHGRIERLHRSALILTFGGGTNEVQRDIVAFTALGLPAQRR